MGRFWIPQNIRSKQTSFLIVNVCIFGAGLQQFEERNYKTSLAKQHFITSLEDKSFVDRDLRVPANSQVYSQVIRDTKIFDLFF